VDREFETHLAELKDELMKEGSTAEEARRAARLQFGNPIAYREQTRERDRLSWLGTFVQDLLYAIRQLKRSLSFAVVAVLLLALGIGVNLAIFTLLNAIVLNSLPLPNANRLVVLLDRHSDGGSSPPSWLDQQDFRAQSHVFDSLGAFDFRSTVLVQIGNEKLRVAGTPATPDYFTTLGVQPLAGRLFTATESQPGQNDVVLLREDFWHSQFGSDPAILGKTIGINGRTCTIVGILPRTFAFPTDNTVLWVPLVPSPLERNDRGWHGFPMVGRLKSGVSLAQAYANLNPIMLRLSVQYPKEDTDRTSVLLFPLHDWVVGSQTRERLLILQYAALVVFLMTCANVSNLVLARYSTRRREFAMRSALGASRFRLVRMRLTEALVLVITSGLASIALAWFGVRFLIYLYGSALPRTNEIGVNWQLLWFVLGIAVAAVFLLGLTNTLHSDQNQMESLLREGAGATGNRLSTKMRKILVTFQVACALALVSGSFQLLQSFRKLMDVNPGFDDSHLLTFHVALPESGYHDPVRINQFFSSLTDRLNHLAGVQTATSINLLPIQNAGYNGDVEIPGLPPHSPSFFAEYRWVTGDYLRTMGIPLVRGRDFLPEDLSAGHHVVIVNQTMARTLWGDRDPVGWTLKLKESEKLDGISFTVIGVAQDVHQAGLDIAPRSEMEMPLSTMPDPATEQVIALRTSLGSSAILPSVRRELDRLESNAVAFDVRTMQEVMDRSYSVSYARILSTLLSAFSVLALLIGAFGLYGVTSYLVTERHREMAIRLAIGASRSQITRFVLRQSSFMLGAGFIVGVLGALFLDRSLKSVMFGVSAVPVSALSLAACVLVIATAAGIAIPTLRATKIDPARSLRQE
jgi:putative ABC transport system permease protein